MPALGKIAILNAPKTQTQHIETSIWAKNVGDVRGNFRAILEGVGTTSVTTISPGDQISWGFGFDIASDFNILWKLENVDAQTIDDQQEVLIKFGVPPAVPEVPIQTLALLALGTLGAVGLGLLVWFKRKKK